MDKQIKEKVEKIGISLKKWGLHIYRGILTGLNEAFIISKQERDELISQDPKSADLIRPILRGKDIKRYRFEYKDLYLICTFPSLHITIDSYPSIKAHLLKTGKERLSQTGMLYVINGKKVKARKKTNNKWFETQDTISYWDDFSKPKIIFKEMTEVPCFAFDEEGKYMCLDTGRIITGKDLKFLLGILNSKLFFYCISHFYGGGKLGRKGVRMKHTFFLNFPCFIPNQEVKKQVIDLVEQIQKTERSFNSLTGQLDQIIYKAYNLNSDEINKIETSEKFN